MTASPIAWETLENALRTWVAEALELDESDGERVLWVYPDAPQVPRPFAVVSIPSGPVPQGRHDHRVELLTMRDAITVSGTGAIVVRIHGIDPDDAESFAGRTYTAGPGASAAAVRDELLAELAAEDGIVAAARSSTAIQVDGTDARRRFHLVAVSGPVAVANEIEAARETVYTENEITVRVQVEAATQRPSGHAKSYAARLVGSLGDPTIRRDLRASGLFYRRAAPPQDLTALVGDRHVSRVAQDFFFAINAAFDRPIQWVRTADVAGTVTA